ncbi:MAG: hypothetical protein WC815_03980 [Vicinamibacterales bacterium]|jgi:hypothetical protein
MTKMRDSVTAPRIEAIEAFGFTERQARFLVAVMVYSGAFLERQYCAFAGIAHGQKTHDFIRRLIDRKCVTVITPGALHRGRLFHVHFKPLYDAIGEVNNRNRRPATLGRMVERLMLLDAVLADRRHTWLGTERDKVAYFSSLIERPEWVEGELPHLTFGEGAQKTIRYFPDKFPIGLDRDYGGRHVFLYLVTQEVPAPFRMFLFRHSRVLSIAHYWTIRLVVPRRFRNAKALYRYALRDECSTPLRLSQAEELECVLRHRAGTTDGMEEPRYFDLAEASRRFASSRFRARYRMWQIDPARAITGVSSSSLRDQLERGDGRIEFMELPHQYLRLTSLIGVA